MHTNPYQTLGVQRNATEEEIKKAYRKLASVHHPDKKGGNTAKFQEIQTAYDTLANPTKRAQFDNPHPYGAGVNETRFEFNQGAGGPDIFSQFFRAGGNPFHGFQQQQQQQQQRKNKDLRVNISVTLESTLKEQQKVIMVTTTNGGQITVNVTIPRGVANGTAIKYPQMGDNFFNGLVPGDLYVVVTVMRNTRFEVQGINLITGLEINSIEAMVGVQKEIEGIDGGKYLVTIPAGCQFGTNFSLQGKGLHQLNSNLKGDLIVAVTVKTLLLTESQIHALNLIYSTL